MAFIMGSWKILQRRTYDILSHKYSFGFLLLGFLILTVSVIQFGEVWIEWSQSENLYDSYSDNILGKSLQKKLCQLVPIDAVYTWVNGTDPVLLNQMKEYRDNAKKHSINCPFTKCMASHFAAYRGWEPPFNIPYKKRKIQLKGSGDNKFVKWSVIEYKSPEEAMNAVHLSIDSGFNTSLSWAYWTSDKSAPNSFLVSEAVICSDLPPEIMSKIENMSTRALFLNFHVNIKKVWKNSDGNLMILELLNPVSSKELYRVNNVTILGYKVNVTNAYLVLELPPPWDSQDLAPSRFEDKEELRYSLRSLEKYAPWVRHVYLVTNGQIPYWLNLDNPRLTLLTHEDIFPDHSHLPTFSSPAIESHIHRIPGISKQFLYLNDDVFFGNDVWPEDFITHAGGQKVYLSWPVPDCAVSCPWAWIGDGSCDISCNVSVCSFDGGDCNPSNELFIPNYDLYDEHHSDVLDFPSNNHLLDDSPLFEARYLNSVDEGGQELSNRTFQGQNISYILREDIIGNLNISEDKLRNPVNIKVGENLHNILATAAFPLEDEAEKYNSSKHHQNTDQFYSVAKDTRRFKRLWKSNYVRNTYRSESLQSWNNRRTRDTFAESLLHVNQVFNEEYGFDVRKVPAHMPHLIDKTVMSLLQERFHEEWEKTSSRKVRSAEDMQFAFSYFYFLMSERQNRTISEIFDIFDTDHSSTWSDREIRTVLSQINDLPLSYHSVMQFEEQICNCSLQFNQDTHIPTPPLERYQDSKLPLVSKMLIENCQPVKKALLEKFGSCMKYQTEIVKDKNKVVTFKMLSSNLSQLIVMLDEIRRDPKKFICLNDNLDPNRQKDNVVVRAVLQDFYESLFPIPSSFELPLEYRNRFLHVSELNAWLSGRIVIRNGIYVCLFLLIMCFILSFLQVECCSFQRKRLRRIYQDV